MQGLGTLEAIRGKMPGPYLVVRAPRGPDPHAGKHLDGTTVTLDADEVKKELAKSKVSDAIFSLHVEDKRLTFCHDFETYFEELTGLFPHQKEELRTFYDYLFDFTDNVFSQTAMIVPPTEAPVGVAQKPRSPEQIRRITEELVPMMSQDSVTLLKRFFT